jgi:hypothetical protein
MEVRALIGKGTTLWYASSPGDRSVDTSSICQSYTEEGYSCMNDDAVRNSFFENGIKAVTHKQAQLRKQKSKQLSKKARETRHHW